MVALYECLMVLGIPAERLNGCQEEFKCLENPQGMKVNVEQCCTKATHGNPHLLNGIIHSLIMEIIVFLLCVVLSFVILDTVKYSDPLLILLYIYVL